MKTYRIKYYITFSFDEKELEVKGETSVEDGDEYSYDDADGIVKNDDTATQYVYSLFANSEENLIKIPEEVMDKVFDTELHITNVIISPMNEYRKSRYEDIMRNEDIMRTITYRVKYAISFRYELDVSSLKRRLEVKRLEVKGEMIVEDGTEYYYDGADGLVTNTRTANDYIVSLFDADVNNLVDIPAEFRDMYDRKELDSQLVINNILPITVRK